jgi:hypothetical protein
MAPVSRTTVTSNITLLECSERIPAAGKARSKANARPNLALDFSPVYGHARACADLNFRFKGA